MWSTNKGISDLPNGDFQEVRIIVPWGHVAGKWWGSKDTQPVVALHGWQDNAGTFDTLAPMLVAEGISLLCIDLPGHGLSSCYPDGQYYYLFWDGVILLRRIVKHYKWTKVTLIGHSLGGGVSFMYASIFPDEVEKYISIDIAAPLVRDTSKIVSRLGPLVDKFLEYGKLSTEQQPCYDYEEMVNAALDGYHGSLTRKSCEILLKRGMKRVPGTDTFVFSRDVRLKSLGLAYMTLDQALDFASHIRCEVLNIKADPGLTFEKPEYYDAVIAKIKEGAKRAEHRVVAGSHHVHLNNPERLICIIVKFLKS